MRHTDQLIQEIQPRQEAHQGTLTREIKMILEVTLDVQTETISRNILHNVQKIKQQQLYLNNLFLLNIL